MIARLTGAFTALSLDSGIVDVRGVGYHVLVPIGTESRVAKENGEVTLSVYTAVREDAIQLFGFATEREKFVFVKLISVSGIGPKTALSVLSDLSVTDIISAVQTDDLARFTSVSGIGKKTAQRLLLELKNKFTEIVTDTNEVTRPEGRLINDLRSALLNLGYKPVVVEDVVKSVEPMAEKETEVEPLLRRALQLLS